MQNKTIKIYTDGSCLGNPGVGGWGAVILYDNKEIQISGNDKDTTNNRMEMTAIISALEWLRHKSGINQSDLQNLKIIIHSDSNLLVQSLTRGWKRKKNTDLWAKMDKARAWLNISWVWIKAHHTNKYNNLADKLAFNEAKKST